MDDPKNFSPCAGSPFKYLLRQLKSGSQNWELAFGNPLSPSDDAYEFDFNGNGFIDIFDIMDMLSMQPSVNEFVKLDYEFSPYAFSLWNTPS